jgi:alpha-D-ribose 1-methylphosphonate 5-triphosphate synthase subunit PhnL
MNPSTIDIRGVGKNFTLHQQDSLSLDVLQGVNLSVQAGECVVLKGASGLGKSTLLKLIYGNYRASAGQILVQPRVGPAVDVVTASPRALTRLRRDTLGYVSQFLRVIPRISALDVVAEPLTDEAEPGSGCGAMDPASAQAEARRWLQRLAIPERLWHLPPATFSGGEQQRINIARSMIKPRAVLLLDEPTASLDPVNARTVVSLIHEARERGAALLGIFHDTDVGQAVASRHVDMADFRSF